MGNTLSIKKINFEDMQKIVIKNPVEYLIINTLPVNNQNCLICNTILAENEESIINKYLNENKNISIVIYGKNCNDETTVKKFNQLSSMGFYRIYIYNGGLFEWLLLQDIYGSDLFPTTKKEVDILKYKPSPQLNIPLLEYY
jgi:hypothetical protein